MNRIYFLPAGIFEKGRAIIGLKQMDKYKNLLWTAIFCISIKSHSGRSSLCCFYRYQIN
jgi:hypothetical protein